MALELTTTRRRTPLSETTFVKRVPSYMKTSPATPGYHGLGYGPNAFEPYGLGAPRGFAAREALGFGELDSEISVERLQQLLRQSGSCAPPGGRLMVVDNSYGPITYTTLMAWTDGGSLAVPGTDFQTLGNGEGQAPRGSRSIMISSSLLARLTSDAAGRLDQCPGRGGSGGSSGGSGGNGGAVDPGPGNGTPAYTAASVFSNPMLWLGIGAVALVGYYAWKSNEDEMMMVPSLPRL